MTREYNKLVRDKIPELMEQNSEGPVFHTLSEEEYSHSLYEKLREECNELISAKSKQEKLEELADISEVINAIQELEGITTEEINEMALSKRLKKGGFEKRIFLERTAL